MHVVYDKKNHSFKEFTLDGIDINDEEIYKIGLQKYHYINIKDCFDITVEELDKNGKSKVIATSCRDVVEEYMSNNQHLDEVVEDNQRLIVEK